VNKGFSPVIAVLVLAGIAVVAFFILKTPKPEADNLIKERESAQVNWDYDPNNNAWQVKGTPPECPDPLVFPSPVEVNLVSGILYPGQIRGGDYKAHGGFRLDSLTGNEVGVYAPFDGNVTQAARHTQGDEVQYVLYFVNDCGIMYKFDHLLELTDKFKKILENVPLKGETDTRTTFINPPVFTSKGEQVATKVGLSGNIFFDFGVYDLRQKNGVDYSTRDYYNIGQYGEHAICWLDNLEPSDKSLVKSLPGADGESGKSSDYCR